MERLSMEIGIRSDKWQRQAGEKAARIMVLKDLLNKEQKFKKQEELKKQIYEIEKAFWQEVGAFSEARTIRDVVENRIKQQEEDTGLHEAGN